MKITTEIAANRSENTRTEWDSQEAYIGHIGGPGARLTKFTFFYNHYQSTYISSPFPSHPLTVLAAPLSLSMTIGTLKDNSNFWSWGSDIERKQSTLRACSPQYMQCQAWRFWWLCYGDESVLACQLVLPLGYPSECVALATSDLWAKIKLVVS